jgi:hypothetical protein
MGRRPIGKIAMTDAQRQRKRREILAEKAGEKWRPPKPPNLRRRGSSVRRMTEERFLELLTVWLAEADEEEVARFLAFVSPTRTPTSVVGSALLSAS